MRIVYLIFKTAQNAGNRVVFGHVNELRKRHYTVEVIALFGGQPTWYEGNITVKSVASVFSRQPADVLVATFWPTAYVAEFITARRKFYFLQAWEEDFYENAVLKSLVTWSKTREYSYIVNSLYLERKLKKVLHAPVSIIKNTGINKKYFFPIMRSPYKRPHILCVLSWYNHAKGPDLLEKTITELKSRHPEYYTTLVSLERTPLKGFDRFVRAPTLRKLAGLYQQADVLVSTSRSEGFFIPGLEAMACGLPVISTNSGGIKEYLIHKQNGLIAKNHQAIVKDDMIELVLKNKKLKEQLKKNGLKTASLYKWKDIGDQLEKIYGV